MPFYTSNNQGQSDSLFKKPSGFPSRSRKNFNNTQSTCNNENVENCQVIFKQVEERYEVLKKLCQDQPEDLSKILYDTVDRLTEACYRKVAEKVLPQSTTQGFTTGASSLCLQNTRSSVPAPSVCSNGTSASSYGPTITNIQAPTFESTRRRNNSTATSKNHYGLLNSAIPDDNPVNFPSDQFSRANDVNYEPEPPLRTVTNKPVRSKKVTPITQHVEKPVTVPGLNIPLPPSKPKPTAAPSKQPSKKQFTEIKELEVLPSEDEGDSLSHFFGNKRNLIQSTSARSKQSDQSNKATKAHNLSVSIQRYQLSNEKECAGAADSSRKRKALQTDEAAARKKSPVAVEKDLRPSPDTTTPNFTARKTANPANDTLRRSNRNASILSTRNVEAAAAKCKQNKENREKPRTAKPKSQKEAKNTKTKTAPERDEDVKAASVVDKDAASKKNDGEEVTDDASFFGDVSSIVGADSIVLTNTMAKNTTKHSAASRTDMQSHFFSPFANIRSTSGVSAISTPLSKTLTKNVLGKRVKKPNAVAEFKNAQKRKPQKATDVAPISENNAEVSESSESELEGSDFSD